MVSTSCSLLHTAVDLVNETKLDKEIKSWLAFAAQKIVEVNALAKALSGHKDEVLFPAHCLDCLLVLVLPLNYNKNFKKLWLLDLENLFVFFYRKFSFKFIF